MYRVVASILLVLAVLGGYYLANGSFETKSAPSGGSDSEPTASAPAAPAASNDDPFSKLKQ